MAVPDERQDVISIASGEPVLLFDGTCAMCTRLVPWIIAHESDHRLRFAGLQTDVAARVLGQHGVTTIDSETMYVIDDGRVYVRSDAVARITRHLRWPWRAGKCITMVPRGARDTAYRFVAHRRHRWFGARGKCDIPVPDVRERLLG